MVVCFWLKSGFGDKAKTTWANCSIWGKRGEAVAQYLVKGQLVGIVGEVTLDEYTDRDGAKRSSLKVRVNDLTRLGKSDRQDSAPSPRRSAQPAAPGNFDDFDDGIPF